MDQPHPCRNRALFSGHFAVAVLALTASHGLSLAAAPGWATARPPALAGSPTVRRVPTQRRRGGHRSDGASD